MTKSHKRAKNMFHVKLVTKLNRDQPHNYKKLAHTPAVSCIKQEPTMASLHGIYALSLLLFFAVADISVRAKTRHHRWEIAYQFKSPDCFQKLAVTINGQTPGPTINAQQGDTVVVEVKNGLDTENTAIHWHGIRQANCFLEKFLAFHYNKD